MTNTLIPTSGWYVLANARVHASLTPGLAAVFDLPFLMFLPRVFVFVALATWTLAFAGLVRSLARTVRTSAHATS